MVWMGTEPLGRSLGFMLRGFKRVSPGAWRSGNGHQEEAYLLDCSDLVFVRLQGCVATPLLRV